MSRNEDILQAIINGESLENFSPQSRMESLLLMLGSKIESGGSIGGNGGSVEKIYYVDINNINSGSDSSKTINDPELINEFYRNVDAKSFMIRILVEGSAYNEEQGMSLDIKLNKTILFDRIFYLRGVSEGTDVVPETLEIEKLVQAGAGSSSGYPTFKLLLHPEKGAQELSIAYGSRIFDSYVEGVFDILKNTTTEIDLTKIVQFIWVY